MKALSWKSLSLIFTPWIFKFSMQPILYRSDHLLCSLKIFCIPTKKNLCAASGLKKVIYLWKTVISYPGLVECMAQTAAAGTGYSFKKCNKPVPVGYIGAVQKLQVTRLPPVNAEIMIEICLLTHVLQVSLVSGLVKYKDDIIASCEMKIFVTQPS